MTESAYPEMAMKLVYKKREEGKTLLLNLFTKLAIEGGYPEVAKQIDGQAW